MNCIKCDRYLASISQLDNQPLNGTEFVGGGAYGSKITDDNSTRFIINVCDTCIETAIMNGRCKTIPVDCL
jgi:hypothetical protein